MKRVFSNAVIVSKLSKYLDDHDRMYFDVFLRSFHAFVEHTQYQLSKKSLIKNKSLSEIENLAKLLARSIDEYKIEKNEFISNQIKFRETIKLQNDLNTQLIYNKLLLNNKLFGDRLKYDFWNERLQLAIKINSVYRGNIQLYLQHNRLLREKYVKLKDEGMKLLNDNKTASNVVLSSIEKQTINILKEMYDNSFDDSLGNSVDSSLNNSISSSYSLDTIDSTVNNIMTSYEDNITNLIKQNDKWRSNHIRKILRDVPTSSSTNSSNTNNITNKSLKSSALSTEDKTILYRDISLEKSREFTKHMVDVVERCVVRVIDNCDKKTNLLKTLKKDLSNKAIKNTEIPNENTEFSKQHFEGINNKFNSKIINKLNDLSLLQQNLLIKQQTNTKKLQELFENI